MSKINVLNVKGEKVKDITLSKEVWNIEPNDAVLYDAIRLAQALQRGVEQAYKAVMKPIIDKMLDVVEIERRYKSY